MRKKQITLYTGSKMMSDIWKDKKLMDDRRASRDKIAEELELTRQERADIILADLIAKKEYVPSISIENRQILDRETGEVYDNADQLAEVIGLPAGRPSTDVMRFARYEYLEDLEDLDDDYDIVGEYFYAE